jgi:hypothetical protein
MIHEIFGNTFKNTPVIGLVPEPYGCGMCLDQSGHPEGKSFGEFLFFLGMYKIPNTSAEKGFRLISKNPGCGGTDITKDPFPVKNPDHIVGIFN